MDNVTHSLAGLALSEAAVRLRAARSGAQPWPHWRAIAAFSSVIAANLPDFDLLYTGTGGDRLRYMLHHRGYSHTIVAAIACAVLLWGAVWLVWRWRERKPLPHADAGWLLALIVVSTLSHLALDWTNSYGVHPFWPFSNAWRYGDAVFIVEPWFWVASVPALVAAGAVAVYQLSFFEGVARAGVAVGTSFPIALTARSTNPGTANGLASDNGRQWAIAQALADGKLGADGVFHATKIQAKCASKYEAKPVQNKEALQNRAGA